MTTTGDPKAQPWAETLPAGTSGDANRGVPMQRRPRLLIVAHEAGAWVHHRSATAQLAERAGWDVTLLIGGKGDPVPLADGEMPVHQSLPMERGTSGPMDVIRSLRMLRAGMRNTDVVELVTLKPIVLGMSAWRTLPPRRRPRVVATFAGLGTVLDAATQARFHWFTALVRLLLRNHATVLVENPDDAATLIAAGVVRSADVTVGPGVGLPDEWLELESNDSGDRAAGPGADRGIVVLYVGRLITSKGVKDIVAAAQILKVRDAQVRVVLAGALDDRNPSAVSADEVAAWQAAGLVQWLGHVQDLLPVYRTADLVVLPSHREGRPRSLMEAQALGIAVIASDVPGCRQVLDPGVTGVLVPAHDPIALAEAIVALASDPDRRRELGRRGRLWARDQFAPKRFLDVWSSTVLHHQATGHPTSER